MLTYTSTSVVFSPRQGLPAPEIAALPTRTSSTKNPTYFPFTPRSISEFDAFVVLDSATYARGGPPLP